MSKKTETKTYSDVTGEELKNPVSIALHWDRRQDAAGSMEDWSMHADLSIADAQKFLYNLSKVVPQDRLAAALTMTFREKWREWIP